MVSYQNEHEPELLPDCAALCCEAETLLASLVCAQHVSRLFDTVL